MTTPAPPYASIFVLRGELAAALHEPDAVQQLVTKLRLPSPAASGLDQLAPYAAELVRGYATRQEPDAYACGLARAGAWPANVLPPNLRDGAEDSIRRWARSLTPPHAVEFIDLDEALELFHREISRHSGDPGASHSASTER